MAFPSTATDYSTVYPDGEADTKIGLSDPTLADRLDRAETGLTDLEGEIGTDDVSNPASIRERLDATETATTAAQADATQGITDAATAQSTADTHIADSSAAHAASAIANTPAGNIVATNIQTAIDELDLEKLQASAVSAFVLTLLDDANAAAFIATLGALASTSWAAFAPAITRTGDHTFTIAGADYTAIFTKGTRVRYTDTGTEYGVVGSSSFSTDTTVNLIPNSDYAMSAGVTTTSLAYSYAGNPPGFPGRFNWAPTVNGFSSAPTTTMYQWSASAGMITLYTREGGNGTSSAASHSYSLPITAATVTNGVWRGHATSVDNGGSEQMGALQVASAGTTAACLHTPSSSTYTGSGNSRMPTGTVTYPF